MIDFYVYVHRRATTGEIFYVGKGSGYRAKVPKRNNKLWHSIVAKDGYTVEFVETGLQEQEAFALEVKLIALHGRRDLGLGPLANHTDGGEGAAGISEETREKKRLAGLDRKHSAETKAKLSLAKLGVPNIAARGRKLTEEQVAHLRKVNLGKPSAFKGRTHSPESLAKQRAAKLGKKMPTSTVNKIKQSRVRIGVVSPSAALVFDSFAQALLWLKGLGFAKAAYPSLRMACKGLISQSYGYTWRYATPEETAALKEKGASWAPLSDLAV
jgi:hypothetical protein